MNQFTRGIGTDSLKRVANLEAFLANFGHQRAVVQTPGGKAVGMDIIARRSGPGEIGITHPFKIEVGQVGQELRLYVHFGAVSALVWKDGMYAPMAVDVPLHFGGTKRLLNDPWNDGEAGYHVIAKGKTYGVWLSLAGSFEYITPQAWSTNSIWQLSFRDAGSNILISTTEIKPSTPPEQLNGVVCRFIGAVSVDADGVVEVKQHLRSDIDIQLADTYSTS